jgi:predicted nucleic acid-binding Zn ribbon protein
MNYSYIPQKKVVQIPVYNNNCDKCGSNKTFSIMNMIGAHRTCQTCNKRFKPIITHYNSQTIEVNQT